MVVTGASSGIGLATAHRAAAGGASVVLVARDEEGLRKVRDDIVRQGGRADYVVADIGDEQEVEAALDQIVARHGRFDCWVSAAGVALYARLDQTPTHDHELLFRTNYWGTVFCTLAAARHLKQRGGVIITVGSIASSMGAPILGAYAASKHAVKGFIDSLRIELLHERAPVVLALIKPSGIDTPLADHAGNRLGSGARIPPPLYTPDVVARAIVHVAQHPVRELTVGGAGVLQTLLATHAPSLFDRLSTLMIPVLSDDKREPPPTDNLDRPVRHGGQERSGREWARGVSLYTSARLHPGIVAAGCLVAGAALTALVRRRRSRGRPSSPAGAPSATSSQAESAWLDKDRAGSIS